MIRAIFRYVCRKEEGQAGQVVRLEKDMQFIPPVGMQVSPDDAHWYLVEVVRWRAGKPDQVMVFVRRPDEAQPLLQAKTLGEMVSYGWEAEKP
jgi:hypothetical protein